MAQLAIDDSAAQHDYAPNSAVFVLLHGLFGSGENLGGIRRALAPFGRVLSVDLPGHGESAALSDYRHRRVAEALFKALDALHAGPVHLLGHSWGGKVAFQCASLWPDRVASLVILDIAPVAYAPGHDDVFAAVASLELSEVDSRKRADTLLQPYLPNAAVRAFLLKNLRRSANADVGYQWRIDFVQLEQHYSDIAAAPELAAAFEGPVLVLKGEASPYIQAAHSPAFATFVPRATFKRLQGAGHWLHAEKAAAVERLILNFYDLS